MYVDETYERTTRYIVLSGFIVDINDWHKINLQLNKLKIKYFGIDSINIKEIRRRRYSELFKNLLGKISLEEIKNKVKSFFEEFFQILLNNYKFTIISALIDKEKMNDKNKNLLFYLAYSFIIERYEYVLDENKSVGIVIMDSAESNEEIRNLYYVHKAFLRDGVPVKREDLKLIVKGEEFSFKNYKKRKLYRVSENLIFFNDEDCQLLQIADMVCYAISLKYNKHQDYWYEKILPYIRKSKNGIILGYGLKIFPVH